MLVNNNNNNNKKHQIILHDLSSDVNLVRPDDGIKVAHFAQHGPKRRRGKGAKSFFT